jgi:hypothetical protein
MAARFEFFRKPRRTGITPGLGRRYAGQAAAKIIEYTAASKRRKIE